MPLGFAFQRIVSCCQPAANWGPYLERHRGERYSHVVDPKKKKEHEIPTVFAIAYKKQWDACLDDSCLAHMWVLSSNTGKGQGKKKKDKKKGKSTPLPFKIQPPKRVILFIFSVLFFGEEHVN